MPFQKDEEYAADVGPVFGDYIATFISEPKGQVHAYLFRKGKKVDAHVSFAPGLYASKVTEPYVSPLWEYARAQGFADNFQLIMASS